MSNRRKIIVGVLISTMALAGVLAGTLSADDEGGATPRNNVLARVAEILGLPQADVENAFEQAMTEQREERQVEMQAARDARLQDLIDEGVLTQEQVDEWESWLEAQPNNRDEMRAWFESRPDMGDAFNAVPGDRGPMAGGIGPRGMMPRGPMAGGRSFAGMCPASEAVD
jgi:hypothetical protein